MLFVSHLATLRASFPSIQCVVVFHRSERLVQEAMPPKNASREKRKVNAEQSQQQPELLPEHADENLPDVLVKYLKNTCVCTVCGPGHRFVGRTHSSRSGHPWRPMNPDERTEEIMWWREIEAEGDAARFKILQAKRERAHAAAQTRQVEHAQVPERGLKRAFDFGKHAKESLEKLWKTDKSYLVWCVSELRFFEGRLHFKQTLEDVRILNTLLDDAKKQQVDTVEPVIITLQP